jgi:hypothetical protein
MAIQFARRRRGFTSNRVFFPLFPTAPPSGGHHPLDQCEGLVSPYTRESVYLSHNTSMNGDPAPAPAFPAPVVVNPAPGPADNRPDTEASTFEWFQVRLRGQTTS